MFARKLTEIDSRKEMMSFFQPYKKSTRMEGAAYSIDLDLPIICTGKPHNPYISPDPEMIILNLPHQYQI